MARSNHKTCAALVCVAALILLSAAGRPAFAAEASPDRSLPADQAAKLGPELAALYEKRGDFEKAEAAFKALVDLEPSNIYFITKYAEMLARHDRPKALEALKKIPRGREDSVEANLDYVAALHRLGFADESVAAADDAAMKFRDYRFPYMLAGFAREAGDRDGAMKYYIDALGIASHEPEVRLLVAECGGLILEAADFDREFTALRNGAALAESNAEFKKAVCLNLIAAYAASEKGNAADAEAACRAVWDNRDRAGIIFDDLPALLGGMLERAGAWEKAAEIYRAAIDSGEQNPRYYMALGRAYLKASNPDLALATWRELVKDQRGMNPANHFLLVETLLANGMTDEADKASAEAVEQFPAAIELVIQRLKILTGGDRDPDAAAKLIADTLKQVDPAHQAEAAYAIVMALPSDADAQKIIERALAENGKIEQALVEALLKQAEALAAENKKDEAIALCNKVLALAADEASAAKAREIIKRLETGNTQEAGGND